jgi:hypothetical protein
LAGFYTDDMSPWVLSSIHIQRLSTNAQTVQLLTWFSYCGISSQHMSCIGADVGKVALKSDADEAVSVDFSTKIMLIKHEAMIFK